jgi:adenosylcobinamide kinase / adenosylcobinamide-phosphate guanylyltransferase
VRVTLLGTGAADGWPNPFCTCRSCSTERAAGRARRPSSALVDSRILIDCGPTTPHLPAGADTHLADVEHVLVTHGHPDHLHPAFLLTRSWTSPDRPLHVWAPPLALDMCRHWIGPDSDVLLHAITPGDEAELPTAAGTYKVAVLPARHAHGNGDELAAEAVLFAVTAPDGGRLLYATDTGPFAPAEAGVPADAFDLVLVDETFGDKDDHGTGHLDLVRLPGVLDALRAHGSIGPATVVVATHLSHHNPPTAELLPRLAALGVRLGYDLDVLDTSSGLHDGRSRHLVLGGARSGKSHFAEGLVAGQGRVRYVATGGQRPDDAEWSLRVRQHRARRPAHWQTVESTDVAGILRAEPAGGAVLVDCLALWLTAVLDELDAWTRIEAGGIEPVQAAALARADDLVDAVRTTAVSVVLVSNEVGMGVVPATASGRLFRDLLGTVNLRVSAACDETTLLVAGQPLTVASRRSSSRA